MSSRVELVNSLSLEMLCRVSGFRRLEREECSEEVRHRYMVMLKKCYTLTEGDFPPLTHSPAPCHLYQSTFPPPPIHSFPLPTHPPIHFPLYQSLTSLTLPPTHQSTPVSSPCSAVCQCTGRNSTLPPLSPSRGACPVKRCVFSIN